MEKAVRSGIRKSSGGHRGAKALPAEATAAGTTTKLARMTWPRLDDFLASSWRARLSCGKETETVFRAARLPGKNDSAAVILPSGGVMLLSGEGPGAGMVARRVS